MPDLSARREPQLFGLVTGRVADDLAFDHDDKLAAETQHPVQALLAGPLPDLRCGQVKPRIR